MIVPYRVSTLTMRSPWANLAIMAINVIMFLLMVGGAISEDVLDRLVLVDWSSLGFIGYQFLHGGFLHLAGNMILLWVFGNVDGPNPQVFPNPVLNPKHFGSAEAASLRLRASIVRIGGG